MADYSKQIFEMLGVEPNERFKVGGYECEFYITEKLSLMVEIEYSTGNKDLECRNNMLPSLLNGDYEIIKIPQYSEYQQRQIDAAVLLGCPYWARDEDGKLYASRIKFRRGEHAWFGDGICFPIPEKQGEEFTCIQWTDEEPHYFGGDEE